MPSIIPRRYHRILKHPAVLTVAALLIVVGLPVYLFGVRWQAENVLERRWQGFLNAAEAGNARAMAGYLSEDYRDAWGQDKTDASENAAEVLRAFLALNIEERDRLMTFETDQDPPQAKISAELILRGRPAGYVGQEVLSRSSKILAPWEFLWVKEPGAPWNWKILRVDNADLRLTPAELEKIREYRENR
jgi:hypothetical protein